MNRPSTAFVLSPHDRPIAGAPPTLPVRHGFMAGPAIAFMENDQISALNLSVCGQNFSTTARFQWLQPGTKPRISDPAESRLNQQIHENHQSHHNHQIYHGICAIWEHRALRFLPLVLAGQNEGSSEKLRQCRLPHSLSSAYSGGLQLGGVIAAAQAEERANTSVISLLRVAQGLLFLQCRGLAAPKDGVLRHYEKQY
jgi:hypothetical protein